MLSYRPPPLVATPFVFAAFAGATAAWFMDNGAASD
jgi:hypothetical protein